MAHRTLWVLPGRKPKPKPVNTEKEQANDMSLVTIVITLIVVGVLLWLVNTYIPMDGKIKKIINIVVVVVVVLWLLNVFGVMGNIHSIRASIQSPSLVTSTCSLDSPPDLMLSCAELITA
jgi:hypothetical protein